MPHDTILLEYDRVIGALVARGEVVRAEVARLLAAESGLKTHSVTLRAKSRASLARKLKMPDRTYASLWDVTDLVGVRVITYFEDGVDRVGQLVETKLHVDFVHSIDKRRRRDAAGFGYSSLHYVCELASADTPDLPKAARCEIQVRTLLEHAWAEIEHDLGYKADDAVPAPVRRRLNRLAGLLELADNEFVAIRRDLQDYALSLPERISDDADAVRLDRLSLASLLEHSTARSLDEAIARSVDKAVGDETFFPDYLLRMLASSGIETVGQAREGLTRHHDTIVAMVKPYFAFAWATWRLSTDQMDKLLRGYSLFFLAHAVVLRTPALGISKVERLAHLYRQLDYPDDARTAQRVASDLVDAFREVAPGRDDEPAA